jgi:hypothetical protein
MMSSSKPRGLQKSLNASRGTAESPRGPTYDRAQLHIERVGRIHPRTVRRALTLAPVAAFRRYGITSRKRIEINAKLLFLLVPGRGLEPQLQILSQSRS